MLKCKKVQGKRQCSKVGVSGKRTIPCSTVEKSPITTERAFEVTLDQTKSITYRVQATSALEAEKKARLGLAGEGTIVVNETKTPWEVNVFKTKAKG